MTATLEALQRLPPSARRLIGEFVDAARGCLGGELRSIVLFGSGAEGKLRETSDVNLLVLLARFDTTKIDALRAPFRTAVAAVRLQAMFLLEGELPAAARLFADKFADMERRHVTLFGDDPLIDLHIPRDAEIARLKQILLNLVLRLRLSYVEASVREEHLALVVADAVGPVRAAAQVLLALEGKATPSPKDALAQLAPELGANETLLGNLSRVREAGRLEPGAAPASLVQLLELLDAMRARAERLVLER